MKGEYIFSRGSAPVNLGGLGKILPQMREILLLDKSSICIA